MSNQKTTGQKARVTEIKSQDTKKGGQNVNKIEKTSKVPPPLAKGNDQVIILNHSFFETGEEDRIGIPVGVKLGIRNISKSTIATALFETVFYNTEGNIVDTTTHSEMELKPGQGRGIVIYSSIRGYDKFASYNIKLIQTTTADIERVQFRWHQATTTELGEEEIVGIIKNISDIKTNATIIATFYDKNKDSIGTKSVILRDIEPNSTRQYHLLFKPQEGKKVRSFVLNIDDVK